MPDGSATTIWKFPLKVTDVQDIAIPLGSRLLCVKLQHNVPVLYAHVNPSLEKAPVRVFVHGTGHPVHPEARHYLGTFLLNGDHLVFHVFADTPA